MDKKHEKLSIELMIALLEQIGMKDSMNRPGFPYDNSSVESFFETLNKKRNYRRNSDIINDVGSDLIRYIEPFYNGRRKRSVQGYPSLIMYRWLNDAGKVA